MQLLTPKQRSISLTTLYYLPTTLTQPLGIQLATTYVLAGRWPEAVHRLDGYICMVVGSGL